MTTTTAPAAAVGSPSAVGVAALHTLVRDEVACAAGVPWWRPIRHLHGTGVRDGALLAVAALEGRTPAQVLADLTPDTPVRFPRLRAYLAQLAQR